MPLTAKGEKILESMIEQYGSEEEAKRVFYASKKAGKITGVDSRRRRKGKSYDPRGREISSWEEEDSRQLQLPLVTIVDAEPVAALRMYDAVEIEDVGKLTVTRDGYLKAMARIARTGIQLYKGDECGRPDLDVVRVFRPEASVFANDATHSYTHLPVTIDHPGGAVDAANWKKHAVGETGDEVLRDGGTVRVPLMLRDAKAIELVQSGKRQLSVGYGCDLQFSNGLTPDGQEYDAVQHNIRGNHLAIVTHARGGPTLRIGDTTMTDTMKTVMIDGLPCQMSDKDAAIVQRTISTLQDQLDDQSENFKKFKKEKEEKEDAAAKAAKDAATEIATRDGKITALEQQLKDAVLTPEQLDARVSARLAMREQVHKMLPTFKCDGKSDADIRRAVVASKIGDERAKTMSDENIVGAFQAYASVVTPAHSNPINDARAAFAGGTHDGRNPKVVAYNEMVNDMENAWRTPAA